MIREIKRPWATSPSPEKKYVAFEKSFRAVQEKCERDISNGTGVNCGNSDLGGGGGGGGDCSKLSSCVGRRKPRGLAPSSLGALRSGSGGREGRGGRNNEEDAFWAGSTKLFN